MKIIRVNVGSPPEVLDVPADQLTLKYMQDAVGGYIDCVGILPEVSLICNDEGLYCGEDGGPLPANICGIYGNFLISAYKLADGETRSLTDSEVVAALY